jgi:hypothetical protein
MKKIISLFVIMIFICNVNAARTKTITINTDFTDYRGILNSGQFIFTGIESNAHTNCGIMNDSTYYFTASIWSCNDTTNSFNKTILGAYPPRASYAPQFSLRNDNYYPLIYVQTDAGGLNTITDDRYPNTVLIDKTNFMCTRNDTDGRDFYNYNYPLEIYLGAGSANLNDSDNANLLNMSASGSIKSYFIPGADINSTKIRITSDELDSVSCGPYATTTTTTTLPIIPNLNKDNCIIAVNVEKFGTNGLAENETNVLLTIGNKTLFEITNENGYAEFNVSNSTYDGFNYMGSQIYIDFQKVGYENNRFIMPDNFDNVCTSLGTYYINNAISPIINNGSGNVPIQQNIKYCIGFKDGSTILTNKSLRYTISSISNNIDLSGNYTDDICFISNNSYLSVYINTYHNDYIGLSINPKLAPYTEKVNYFEIKPYIPGQNTSTYFCISGTVKSIDGKNLNGTLISASGCNVNSNRSINGQYKICGLYGETDCFVYASGGVTYQSVSKQANYLDKDNINFVLKYSGNIGGNNTNNDNDNNDDGIDDRNVYQPIINIYYNNTLKAGVSCDIRYNGNIIIKFNSTLNEYTPNLDSTKTYEIYCNNKYYATITGNGNAEEPPIIDINIPTDTELESWISWVLNLIYWSFISILIFVFMSLLLFGLLLFLLMSLAISDTVNKLRATTLGAILIMIAAFIFMMILITILPLIF